MEELISDKKDKETKMELKNIFGFLENENSIILNIQKPDSQNKEIYSNELQKMTSEDVNLFFQELVKNYVNGKEIEFNNFVLEKSDIDVEIVFLHEFVESFIEEWNLSKEHLNKIKEAIDKLNEFKHEFIK